MDKNGQGKISRVLGIYTKLLNGSLVKKPEEAANYNVNERSIQRDIDDIRSYFGNVTVGHDSKVEYDRSKKGYRLEGKSETMLSSGEILAVCKILLDSRAFTQDEMKGIIDKLIAHCATESERKQVGELISNEFHYYTQPMHGQKLIENIWTLAGAIKKRRYIEISYERSEDKQVVKRKVIPAAVMFSEYYFYLAAFIVDKNVRKDFKVSNDSNPTIYRIDRIKNFRVLDEIFSLSYSERFEEGKFRSLVQYMYSGELKTFKFTYSGRDINAVLDRFPISKVLSEENGVYTVSVKVLGEKGFNMWLGSQGDAVKILD